MKILVVVQARMGSTRLPGKVLLPLGGAPLLQRMLERVLAAATPFHVCVATTTLLEDGVIVDLCRRLGVDAHRGHPTDLLDRHFEAARTRHADVVVKIPSDCPLVDPAVIDRVLAAFIDAAGAHDFVTNLCPPTYPDGNDVEVMTAEALATAHREATAPWEREHTTPFVWDRPERFRVHNVRWETGLDYSRTHRLTIDYPEDYELIRSVYERLWSPEERVFGLERILEVTADPALRALNAAHAGATWITREAGRLRSVRLEGGSPAWI